jgi:hypothetical protein
MQASPLALSFATCQFKDAEWMRRRKPRCDGRTFRPEWIGGDICPVSPKLAQSHHTWTIGWASVIPPPLNDTGKNHADLHRPRDHQPVRGPRNHAQRSDPVSRAARCRFKKENGT